MKTRVRFAPSPTGPLHIGGVRTALYNYLFAKKNNGDFILRIEDTDQKRYVPGAEEYIIEALEWLNIPYNEGIGKEKNYGPYRQSERKKIYRKYIDQLIANGKAYYAFDTPEELDALRKEKEAKKETFIYNHYNRDQLHNSLNLTTEETNNKIQNGEEYVVRFLNPSDRTLELNDIIRGKITIDTNTLDDKVLFKSDGMPTYHLANIVDDHLMEISHVIRGEEWLPSLALHVLLYEAFEWKSPKFAHLPLIMKPVGKGKLSKRDGAKFGFPVFPLKWTDPSNNEVSQGYREDGYFSKSVINLLALLGWNEGDGIEKEIYSIEELINAFSLEKVSKSGAKFSPEKAKWFNQQYLQQENLESLTNQLQNSLRSKNIDLSNTYVQKVIEVSRERANFLEDILEISDYLFESPKEFDSKSIKKQWKEQTPKIINDLQEFLSQIDDFNSKILEEKTKTWIVSKELGFGKVMQPLRLSLVGALKGIHLFDIMEMIGKEETLDRLKFAVNTIKK